MAITQQKIEVILKFITQGQKAFLNTQSQIDSLSKNINKNKKVITEQQNLQKQGVKEAGKVASSLRAENAGYMKQQRILRGNVGGINKDLALNKKKLSMSNSIMESQKLQTIAGYGPLQVIRMNAKDLGKYNEMGGKFNSSSARMANRFRMMTHGAKGFRMEMLGVMFFGMAMQRVFSGLLKTSIEWVGVTEIMSQTLGILFLPIAEIVLEWALKFLDWVLKLTDSQKKTIGWFVLVGAAIGGLIFLIGTLMLGIGSMILAFNFSKIATIIGGTGLGGIGNAAGIATTKVGNLKTKIGKLAKYAGAAIMFSIALDDAAEGKLTSAVGDMLMGVGFLLGKKGVWAMALGFTLKFLGDADFQSKIYTVFWQILDKAFWFGEMIWYALTAQWKKFKNADFTFFESLGDSANKALAKLSEDGKLTSDVLSTVGEDFSTIYVTEELDKLSQEFWEGKLTVEDYIEKNEELNESFGNTVTAVERLRDSLKNYLQDMKSASEKSIDEILPERSISKIVNSKSANYDFEFSKEDASSMIRAPAYDSLGQGMSMSQTNNIYVQDKAEIIKVVNELNESTTNKFIGSLAR